jgi:hypothetical protein
MEAINSSVKVVTTYIAARLHITEEHTHIFSAVKASKLTKRFLLLMFIYVA